MGDRRTDGRTDRRTDGLTDGAHFRGPKCGSKKYEDLSLEEFCAGYASIPEGIKDRKLQKYRIQHLKELI